MTAKLETFSAVARGVGRKDYSAVVEYATQASMRGHQLRYSAVASFTLPTVPFGVFYTLYFAFPGPLVEAPAEPRHFYSILNTTERNALVICAFYRFASEADYWAFIPDKWYGTMYGYGGAELRFTNGIKSEEGKVYAVALAEYSANPTFTIHMTCHSLLEEVVYG